MNNEEFLPEEPVPSAYTLQNKVCDNCPFGDYRTAVRIPPDTMSDYYQHLFSGGHHICHKEPSRTVVCRGGRKWQIQMFFQMGRLSAPTHKAYVEYLQSKGLKKIPSHIIEHVEQEQK